MGIEGEGGVSGGARVRMGKRGDGLWRRRPGP